MNASHPFEHNNALVPQLLYAPADGVRSAHVVGSTAGFGLQVAVVRAAPHRVVDRGEHGAGHERDGRRGHADAHGLDRPPVCACGVWGDVHDSVDQWVRPKCLVLRPFTHFNVPEAAARDDRGRRQEEERRQRGRGLGQHGGACA